MNADGQIASLAIETTCRTGALALGLGDKLVAKLDFDAARRAAVQTVGFMDELLGSHGLSPDQLDEFYVSVGPGSFTGTRVGVTVARAFAQASDCLRCVAVSTPRAVVSALSGEQGMRAAVVQDARRGQFYITPFVFENGDWRESSESFLSTIDDYLASLASLTAPVILTGEGLGYCEVSSPHVTLADESLWLPDIEQVWSVGWVMARSGEFTDYHKLLPRYTGKPFITQRSK